MQEHVGVNAPGNEKTTTFLQLNNPFVSNVCHSSPTRTGPVTLGTDVPVLSCVGLA